MRHGRKAIVDPRVAIKDLDEPGLSRVAGYHLMSQVGRFGLAHAMLRHRRAQTG